MSAPRLEKLESDTTIIVYPKDLSKNDKYTNTSANSDTLGFSGIWGTFIGAAILSSVTATFLDRAIQNFPDTPSEERIQEYAKDHFTRELRSHFAAQGNEADYSTILESSGEISPPTLEPLTTDTITALHQKDKASLQRKFNNGAGFALLTTLFAGSMGVYAAGWRRNKHLHQRLQGEMEQASRSNDYTLSTLSQNTHWKPGVYTKVPEYKNQPRFFVI